MKKEILVMVCGGFDPLHIGHIDHFKKAKALGDKLLVVTQGDDWLVRKKGKCFMTLDDRISMIKELKCVDYVIGWKSDRDDQGETLELIRPDIFAKGGDRKDINSIPKEEVDACKKYGIRLVFGVDGRIRSSSELLKRYCNR